MTILRWIPFALLFVLSVPSPANAQEFPKATPESQGISSDVLEKLSGIVEDYVERDMAVGVELAIIKNRHLVFHETFGWRDREEKQPLEQGTIYNIRSMTKPITGAAMQILIDEGEVSLDDHVSDYLSGFDNDKCRDITIEQILTHRSGLPLTIIEKAIDDYF